LFQKFLYWFVRRVLIEHWPYPGIFGAELADQDARAAPLIHCSQLICRNSEPAPAAGVEKYKVLAAHKRMQRLEASRHLLDCPPSIANLLPKGSFYFAVDRGEAA
jgi:hypothetical protein